MVRELGFLNPPRRVRSITDFWSDHNADAMYRREDFDRLPVYCAVKR
jgi:hypothetical protein